MGVGNQFLSVYIELEGPGGDSHGDVLEATLELRRELNWSLRFGSHQKRVDTEPMGIGEITHECLEQGGGRKPRGRPALTRCFRERGAYKRDKTGRKEESQERLVSQKARGS